MKLFFVLFLFTALTASSQTVIDYSSRTSAACLFTSATDVDATINGASSTIKHLATVGQINSGSGVISFRQCWF